VRRPLLTPGAGARFAATLALLLAGAVPAHAAPGLPAAAATPARLEQDLEFGSFGVGAAQFNGPAGIAVDSRGRIFVTDAGNHRVEQFDSTGAALGEFGGFGHDAGRFDRPSALWIGDALGVWVLDQGNARVAKYDLEGRPIGIAVDLASDAVRATLGTVEPEGMAADRGGELYLTDPSNQRMIVFDPLGAVLNTRGGFGTANDRFAHPSGIAVDARGRLLVADPGNRRVQLLDSFGGFLATFPLDSTYAARANLVVAFGPDSLWAVGNRQSGALAVRTLGGDLVAALQAGAKGGPLPGGLVFDARGRLLVTDARAHRVLRYRLAANSP
jgi:DNA-binding beta-propeller fold protein YncE